MNLLSRVAVDVGGTFTDAVASNDEGELFVLKIKSTPAAPEEGFLSAIALLLTENKLQPNTITDVIHVGTIGTNLFLGQVGLNLPKVALIATKGFRDVVEIGRQNRSELYNVFFQRPSPLVPRRLRFEISERVDASGKRLQEVSRVDLHELGKRLKVENVQSIAVSFMNSYVNAENEKEAKRILLEESSAPIFLSSEVDPEHREYERTSTTVVNATLAPIVSKYLGSAMKGLNELGINCIMHILSSAGGLVDVSEATNRPIVTIESGPAAGVVGAAEVAKNLGFDRVISLDMGGTSAKAGCIVNHNPLVIPEVEVGGKVHMGRTVKGSGYPIRTPCIDLAEVSAGGGTIIWADAAGALNVGPISAGAEPGPACYGAGGKDATVTDANLVLGRIGTELLGGSLRLDRVAAEEALQRVAQRTNMDSSSVAAASIKLVNLHMAKAVHIVSLERGLDPREFTLVSFGGAGPMHAAELAEEVGIDRVIVPPWPGLFSALSMLLSNVKYAFVKGLLASLNELTDGQIEQSFLSMTEDALGGLVERGIETSNASIQRSLDLRYTGQGYEIEVTAFKPFDKREAIARFEEKHEAVYGYRQSGEKLEVTTLRLAIILPVAKAKLGVPQRSTLEMRIPSRRQVWFEGEWFDTQVLQRGHLPREGVVKGPMIVEELDSTVVVPPRWICENGNAGCIILKKVED